MSLYIMFILNDVMSQQFWHQYAAKAVFPKI